MLNINKQLKNQLPSMTKLDGGARLSSGELEWLDKEFDDIVFKLYATYYKASNLVAIAYNRNVCDGDVFYSFDMSLRFHTDDLGDFTVAFFCSLIKTRGAKSCGSQSWVGARCGTKTVSEKVTSSLCARNIKYQFRKILGDLLVAMNKKSEKGGANNGKC